MSYRWAGKAVAIGEPAILSAGSAVIVVASAAALTAAEFGIVSVGVTGQVVANLLLRAGISEVAMFVATKERAVRLFKIGMLYALTAGLTVAMALSMASISILAAAGIGIWLVVYFLLDFARCVNGAMYDRRVLSRLAGTITAGVGFLLALTALVFDVRVGVVSTLWVATAFYTGWYAAWIVRRILTCEARWPETYADREPSRGRFLIDALILQAGVQIAVWIVGVFGQPEFAVVLRLSQIIFAPVSLASIALRTHTLQRVAGKCWIPKTVVYPWAAVLFIASLPLFFLDPALQSMLTTSLTSNIAAIVPFLPVFAVIKAADVVTNFSVTVMRATAHHEAGSIVRRLWGLASAGVLFLAAFFLPALRAYEAVACVSISMALIGLTSLMLIRPSVFRYWEHKPWLPKELS